MKEIAGIYTLREINTKEELLAAFRFRYDIYLKAPHTQNLLTMNDACMDIEGYDVYSRHFGLFRLSENNAYEMVGYTRVIGLKKQEWVEDLVAQIQETYHFNVKPRPTLFKFLQLFPNAEELLGMPITEEADYLVEVGRFMISPEYRSVGLAQFMVDSLMTILSTLPKLELGVLFCQLGHRRMWERNAFDWHGSENKDNRPWQLMSIIPKCIEQKIPKIKSTIQKYNDEGGSYYHLAA